MPADVGDLARQPIVQETTVSRAPLAGGSPSPDRHRCLRYFASKAIFRERIPRSLTKVDLMGTPRRLTISFDIEVSPDLQGANIHTTRINSAVDRLKGDVRGLVPAVFPWANRIVARHEWSYPWFGETEVMELPATESNTPGQSQQ